jgi:hypothetical protein
MHHRDFKELLRNALLAPNVPGTDGIAKLVTNP